ncbi:MAG: iron-sulfur cluster assembly accessory protein [Chlamydiales bacterium]|nr:iron-sulfur cluster assembly accessory protein [Chlamydiales bacterium]
MHQLITKDMTIEDIFQKFPQKSQKLAQIMTNFGLHCIGCSASTEETLEEGMHNHGMNDKAVEALLEKLNQTLEEEVDLTTISLTKEEEVDLTTISLTKKAAKKFNQILEDEGKSGWALRFEEESGGCRGLEYSLEFSEKPTENDVVFLSEGIQIHVSRKSLDRLLGSVIDYEDGLKGAGFKISNPNVKSSCHCGSSHGY